MVERVNPVLTVSQQCRLLTVSRSSIYRKPAEASAEDLGGSAAMSPETTVTSSPLNSSIERAVATTRYLRSRYC
jgi:hypothetical protein